MATLNSVLAAIEQHIGFPTSRTKQIARRLAEADIIPRGGPRRPPELDDEHFVAIVAASAMDTGIADVVASHNRLRTMTRAGLPDEPGIPPHIVETAWQRLLVLGELARGPLAWQRDVVETQIRFTADPVAEIALLNPHGTISLFHEPGHAVGSWDAGHRQSVTIRGGALVSAVRSLFS